MGLFKRLFTWGKSEANSAMDKLEDPVKMTEQSIREMKDGMQKLITAQAQSKASVNKLVTRQNEFKATAADYTKKANAIQDKIDSGALSAESGEVALVAALNKIENAESQAASLQKQIDVSKASSEKITKNVAGFRKKIDEAETDLVTLKARSQAATANKEINKQLSSVDVDGYSSTIQRMKDKVEATEAEADAYGQINDENKSEEDIINEALAGDSSTANSDLLAKFKASRQTENA